MRRLKQILAWIAIVILLGLYIMTAVMAFFTTPNNVQMFKISLVATIMVPIMMYVVYFIYRLIHPEKMEEEQKEHDEMEEK